MLKDGKKFGDEKEVFSYEHFELIRWVFPGYSRVVSDVKRAKRGEHILASITTTSIEETARMPTPKRSRTLCAGNGCQS